MEAPGGTIAATGRSCWRVVISGINPAAEQSSVAASIKLAV